MQIITAGRTAPNKLLRFGATDTPLDDRGRRDVAALTASGGVVVSGPVRCGPEAAAVETVRLLGGEPVVDAALGGLDVGRWDGLTPEQVPLEQLGQWFGDPASTPHGGESVQNFVERVVEWSNGADAEVIVVAKAVAQALLCDSAANFFATDVIAAQCYEVGR